MKSTKTTKTTKTAKTVNYKARATKIAASRAANRKLGFSERDKRAIAKLNKLWAAEFAA